MEKNQQISEQQRTGQSNEAASGNRPGQELPANVRQEDRGDDTIAEKEERHSESSLPQSADETLGTP